MLKKSALLIALSFGLAAAAQAALAATGGTANMRTPHRTKIAALVEEWSGANTPTPNVQLAKKRCGPRSLLIEGQCILKRLAESFCGPGYRVQGNECVSRYPAEPEPQDCAPGLVWSAQEGCHEDD